MFTSLNGHDNKCDRPEVSQLLVRRMMLRLG